MDGVLIQSDGYYRGLQAAIRLLGKNLGIANPEVSLDHIARLESSGIFHIWDNMAVFSALLLIHVWPQNPKVRIPNPLDPAPNEFLDIADIDFTNFTQKIDADRNYSLTQINELLQTHQNRLDAAQKAYISLLLQTSQEIYQSPVIYPSCKNLSWAVNNSARYTISPAR